MRPEPAAQALNFRITLALAAIASSILILVVVGIILVPAVLIGALVPHRHGGRCVISRFGTTGTR